MKRKFDQDGFTVIVEHVTDQDPDLSYLTDGDYSDCTRAERNKYMDQDTERLKAYERGDWYCIGVCVSIRKQTATNWADGGLEVGRASVWGVESDSGADYIAQVERDMIAEAFAEVKNLRAALCEVAQ